MNGMQLPSFAQTIETLKSSIAGADASAIMMVVAVVVISTWYLFNFLQKWDPADFGYTVVAALQFKRVRFLYKWEEKVIHNMFLSRDKGNFLETNHAQDAWKPILSVESAGGKEWEALRNALLKVFKQISWQERMPAIIERVLSTSSKTLDCRGLQGIIAKVLFELVTDQQLPEEDIPLILEGVDAWTVSLSGKGVG